MVAIAVVILAIILLTGHPEPVPRPQVGARAAQPSLVITPCCGRDISIHSCVTRAHTRGRVVTAWIVEVTHDASGRVRSGFPPRIPLPAP
jgi:uncharacterized alpha/beta hydrolase family protein